MVSITNDKIVVSRFFGLIEQRYPFKEVRRADYLFGSHGILLQFSGGKQITLGAKEFENYYELTKAIASVVEADQNIKVKYFPKWLKILTSIGGFLLLLFLINQSF
ncbi:hypothetical protein [Pontibacter liquoris]|uniref:hypothetical protein n=1 Tax=Pontibacter liquoris TaxID=2905677 RepID=UPI001FA7655D|nr:hypothetical protein [Pontibacter liquoris]